MFQNWNTTYNGSGTSYAAGATYIMPGADTSLYAIWEPVPTYNLSFDERGGTSVSDLNNQLENASLTLPTAPNKSGFIFLNWNTLANGSGTSYTVASNYSMPPSNTVLYAIWDDNDSISKQIEDSGPNNGDVNNDSIADSEQSNISSFTNAVSNKSVGIATPSTCSLNTLNATSEQTGANQDSAYTYNSGFINFAAECTDGPGATIEVTLYFYDIDSTNLVVRKYNPNTNAYFTIQDAVVDTQTTGGQTITTVTYEITDGGVLDSDGLENGIIVDPVGLGAQSIGVPNTGLGGIRK